MKKYELDMTQGSIIKNIALFSVPLMLSGILQLLFNAADIVIVGRFDGETALAAVGSTSSLINLIINIFMGYTTGAGVIIARHFGAGDRQRTSIAVNTCMTMSIIFGIVLMFVGAFFARHLLELMKCPPDVIEGASTYVKIYFMGMPAFMIYNFGSGVLRAVGDTKRPLYYLTIAGVINVLLNLVFVIKLRMGVAGVATATVISQCVSAACVLVCLIKTDGSYRFDIKKLGIDKKEFLLMTRIGIPAGVQGSLFSLSNVTIQSVINSFGSKAVAGNSAASNIEGFVYIIINSSAQSLLTFIGQNFGAGRIDRIKKGIVQGSLISALTILCVSGAVILFSKQLLGIYVTNPEIIAVGVKRLMIISGTYIICGVNENMVASLRGLGSSALPMFTSLFGICGFRLLYIATVFKYFSTIESVYMTYPISWTITGMINGALLIVLWKRLTKKSAV